MLLSDGVRGKVLSQSPELVELAIPGGSHATYTTPDFLAAQPNNLSGGFRVEIAFGLGYAHQSDATESIPEKLRTHLHAGLSKMVPEEQIRRLTVELMEAADSALVYEIEADMTGDAAPKYQDLQREMTRLCVDACNRYGWEIPFPQMVLHGSVAS